MIIGNNSNIYCRAFRDTDAHQFLLAAQESVQTVGKWLPWCHADYSLAEATQWINTCRGKVTGGDAYDLGIFRSSDDALIGGVAINSIDKLNRIGNVGYWIRPSMERQGYALQAVQLISKFGFEELNLVRLEIVVQVGNCASRRVAEKAGAVLESIAANRLMHDGKPDKAAIYVLLPDRSV